MLTTSCLAALSGAGAAATPAVTMYPSYNQALNVIEPKGTSKGGTVSYLGAFGGTDGTAKCQAACLAHDERCWSFVHFPAATPEPPPSAKMKMKIRVASTGAQLQADDKADSFISTRYQGDDDYSRFLLEPVPGSTTGAVRIRVVADKRLVGANAEAGTSAWPAWSVSTKAAAAAAAAAASTAAPPSEAQEVATEHFVLRDADAKAGTVTVQTEGGGGYWVVDGSKGGFVWANATAAAATVFKVSAAEPAGGGGECYAVTSPGFNPSYDPTAVSGTVGWGCRADDDCSLNGVCDAKSGACACRPAWKGARCELLHLLPPTRGAGYRGVDGGHNTSSWGGAVLKGSDGQYHMWAAEMTEHCGIGAWIQNSRVIHATSATPGGAYERKDVVWEVFSHEPEVVPGPNGEYIMYYTANERSEHGWCNCCREGHGPCDGSTGPGDCPGGAPGEGHSYMSYTTDPNGNWSAPAQLFPDYQGGDTNFAPLILANGSIISMWRHWGGGNGGSRQFLATASDWKDMSTYVQHETELFPDLGAAGTEDQFMYVDDDGYYHAVFHHMYGSGTKTQWWLDATGGHAFSRDGWSWTYTGVAWGNATARYNTPQGQGADITFTDGITTKFTRLERPHLVFKGAQLVGDPIYLTNSAQYGTGTNPGSGANNDDQCYTLVQPINQAK